MLFFRDDFFYYLKVAQNLAHGAGSTFNGLVATNGYHPLWLLLLTCLSFFTEKPGYILGSLAIAGLLSGLFTYFLSRRILLLSGLEVLPASAFALLVVSYDTPMLFGGMEVTLTVPLMLLVALMVLQQSEWMVSVAKGAVLGLAISAMILARLDTLIFAVLLLISILIHKSLRKKLRASSSVGVLLGLIPVAFYFLSNVLLFHTLLPISGMAKQLKQGVMPTSPALRSAFDTAPFDQAIIFFILMSIVALAVMRKRFSAVQQSVYCSVLIFPFLYVGILSCRSDWRLWTWYLYPFRPALCISFLLFCASPPVMYLLRKRSAVTAIVLAVLALASVSNIRWVYGSRDTEAIYQAALDLQTFSATHPGIYAMGDRSGMPGYLLADPIVQIEGLVMDRTFLNHIRQQEPLLSVLAAYNVRYYVTSGGGVPSGCFHASEPVQAGPASPHMQAELCDPPVASFTYPKGATANLVRVAVYDLKPPLATEKPSDMGR